MSQSITIKEVMTKAPSAIEPNESLVIADERMKELRALHLPVRSSGRIIGIISERDMLFCKTLKGFDPKGATVADIMTEDPYRVGPQTPVSEVAAQMYEKKLGSALVVDEKDQLLGIFTTTDALRLLAK